MWQSMGASDWVSRVLSAGYKLPFVSEPRSSLFSNHKSADAHEEIVDGAISKLLPYGSAKEVEGWKPKVMSLEVC